MRYLIALLTISALSTTAVAEDFQWRSTDRTASLAAAFKECGTWHSLPDRVVVTETTYHWTTQYHRAVSWKAIDPGCMKELGFALDRSIAEPAANPQYVAAYQAMTGIRVRSYEELRLESIAREQELRAKAKADQARDEAVLARCDSKSPDLTVGDVEDCTRIREHRAAPSYGNTP